MDTGLGEVEEIISRVHKSLECSICLEVLEEPHSTQCNHQFCRKCIDQLFCRRKRKTGAICPLCKAKISKRGLSQNRKLVKVVEAIRNVLASVNEDVKQQGTPHAVVAKTNNGAGNEVSEETPFQGIRNISMLETEGASQNLSKSLKGAFDREVSEVLQTKQLGNTRKSKRIRWSDDTNVSKINSENTEILKTLETANLGRKTRSSTRAAPSLAEKKDKSSLYENLPHTNSSLDQHATLRSVAQSDATSATSSHCAVSSVEHSDLTPRVESFQGVTDKPSEVDKSNEVCQDAEPVENPTKYIVAETPLLPLQGNSNEEQPAERSSRSGILLVKKKTSPFSLASVRVPLKPQDPNIFDFVDDDPVEKSDLYERVKQRRRREDVKSGSVVKSKAVKLVNDAQRDCSNHREEGTSKTSKSSKNVSAKTGSEATRQKKPRMKRGRGKMLLKEAWEVDEDRNSQLIDTASTASLGESLNAACPNVGPRVDESPTNTRKHSNVSHEDGNAEACSIESRMKDISDQAELATDDGPLENLATSLPKEVCIDDKHDAELISEPEAIPSQDNLEGSVVYKESPGLETDKPFKHEDAESSRLLNDSSASDVVPPSVSSSSTPFHGPINPMESPLYEKCNLSTGFEAITGSACVSDAESRESVNIAAYSSIGDHIKSQSNGESCSRSQEASRNLYSETRGSENVQAIISNSGCSLSIAAAEEPLTDDRPKDPEACTDSILNGTAFDHSVSKNAPKIVSCHDKYAISDTEKDPTALDNAEIIAQEMELENVLVECKVVNKQSEECRLSEVQDPSAGQTKEGADGKDERGEQTSTGSTPSLCDEELFSQGTYFDDGVLGKSLEDTEDPCCMQISEGIQSHSMVLEHNTEVAEYPRKILGKSLESSTDDNTQPSISILVKKQFESEIDGLISETALKPDACSGEKPIAGAIHARPEVDAFTQTIEEARVSSACQTEFAETLVKQGDAGDHAEMISVACQTIAFDEHEHDTEGVAVQRQKMSKALTMSQACQTVKSSFINLSGEDYSPMSNERGIDNVNAASSCSQCKRRVSKVPKDVFETVRKNIQDAVARADSSIMSKGIDVPVNFTVSDQKIKVDTTTESESEMLESQTSACIRIERLNFVPIWMTSDEEFSPKDDKNGSILESKRDIRTSKRNLLKRFTNKSLKCKAKKDDDCRPPTDRKHNMEIDVDPEEEEDAESAEVSSNIIRKCNNESEKEEHANVEVRENVKENGEVEKDVNEIDTNDIILPTPPSEILKNFTTDITTVSSKAANPVIASGTMFVASQGSSSTHAKAANDIDSDSLPSEYKLGNGDSIGTPVSSLSDPIYESCEGKPGSASFRAEEAERELFQVENVAVGKSSGKSLRLKRKSKRQLVKSSGNSSSSKKAKLNADCLLVNEPEGSSQECSRADKIDSVVDCSVDIDKNFPNSGVACPSPCKTGLEKSVESSMHSLDIMVDSLEGVSSQISCSYRSGRMPTQEEQVRKRLLKRGEEDSVSILEDKADNDLNLKSFAVLERREDIVLTDEAIAALDTPVCEEVQNSMVNEERAATDRSVAEGEDFNDDTGNDRTTSNLIDVGENGPSQKKQFHNTTLDDPSVFADFAEDDERDLFASDVGEEDEEHNLQGDHCSLAEEDLEENLGSAPGSCDGPQNVTQGKLDGDHRTHVERKAADCTIQDSLNAERERMVAAAGSELDAMGSIGTTVRENNDFLNVGEEANFLFGNENIQSSCVAKSRTESITPYKHREGNFGDQEITTYNENSKMDSKNKPDFMALVKEYVKGKGSYPQDDESDEETSFIKPCIEEGGEKGEVQFPGPEVQNSKNQGKEQACDVDASSPSPTPPPRVKRKRASPVEAQAALKEIKKLIRSEEDGEGNLRVKEATNVKKPELEFVRDISKSDRNFSQRKIAYVPDNQPIDQVSPPKPHHATPKQIPPPNRAQRLSETPKNLLKGASIGENNEEVNGSSLVKKALDKGVITTPKLKEEKPLLEKNSRIGRSNMDHTKIRKLPQMLVPSRLNKKQMIACKYLASKLDCKFSNSFLRGTTHLIMGTDETYAVDRSAYTFKYLMALINGSWIVSFQWVHACLDSGRAVDESRFEVKGDPSSDQEIVPKYARLSRQRKELPLFHDLSLTLLGDFQSSNMTKDQLVELLERGGAEIFFDLPQKIPSKNYLLILESENIDSNLKAKFVEANIQPIHYEWITESIINYNGLSLGRKSLAKAGNGRALRRGIAPKHAKAMQCYQKNCFCW